MRNFKIPGRHGPQMQHVLVSYDSLRILFISRVVL